jgi:MoaA/NifB/PqqE/SkfB family radical SAM enzyme
VQNPYTLRDYLHFLQLYRRNQQRQRKWGREYETAVRDGSFKLPAATVVQLIPTEACNLRCPFCNQWGENGYFLAGAREVATMDESGMAKLVEQLSPRDSLINIHGGEPFAYKHIDTLLGVLAERQFDVLITTNGTLLGNHLEELSRLRNLSFILSIDGDEETHDRIRGKGTFQKTGDGITRLFDLRRSRACHHPWL